MLNRLALECIGNKKSFTARWKPIVYLCKISQLKITGMACFPDHSEMKLYLPKC